MSICKFLNKEVYYKKEIINEYKFFKENYKKIRSYIKNKRLLYDLLFYNRNLFFYIVKLLYKIKGAH